MEAEMFVKVIEHYGEENIMGFGFDNSAGKTFREGEFTLSNMYIPEIESLQFVEYDRKGRPFHVVKHVSHIQHVVVRDSGIPFSEYDDDVTLRG